MSKRAYIPLPELLASALADLLPQMQRDQLRAARVPAKAVIRLFTPDHNHLHALGGPDLWWNLTMRQRGPDLKAKDSRDTAIVAKVKRLRGETCNGPRKPWPKGRKLQSRGFERRP